MVLSMRDVADSCGFDEHAFQEWADKHGHKHGAFLDTVTLETAITTWNVDQLVKAARAVGFINVQQPMAMPV